MARTDNKMFLFTMFIIVALAALGLLFFLYKNGKLDKIIKTEEDQNKMVKNYVI